MNNLPYYVPTVDGNGYPRTTSVLDMLSVAPNGVEVWKTLTDGSISGAVFTGATKFGDGSASAPSIAFAGHPTTGLFFDVLGHLSISAAGNPNFAFGTSADFRLQNDAGSIIFGGSNDTTLSRPAAGKLTLTGTTPMFQLGGTTNSFPALKQNGTSLQARLADDSAFAPLTGSILTATAAICFGGSGVLLESSTAPTISSGFGTTPSISASNGTAAFLITIGSGGVASTGVITLPTATTGWIVMASDMTTPGVNVTKQTASSTTSATLTNFNSTTGAAAAWAAGDVIRCIAMAY